MLTGSNKNLQKIETRRYLIEIASPLNPPSIIIKGPCIHEVLSLFQEELEEADCYDRGTQIITVIKLIKHAIDFEAELKEAISINGKMLITFSFASIEKLIKFRDTINLAYETPLLY